MMGEGLGLKGCDLLLYANIMSYSKQGKEMYEPIVRLAERFGYSRKQIAKALEYLVDRGLIFRSAQKRPGSHSYSYSINWEKVEQFDPFLNKDGTPANGNKSYIGTKDTCEQKLHPNGNFLPIIII